MKLAIDDQGSDLKFIALRWDAEIQSWHLVSLGRTLEEIDERVEHWRGKGLTDVVVFAMARISFLWK